MKINICNKCYRDKRDIKTKDIYWIEDDLHLCRECIYELWKESLLPKIDFNKYEIDPGYYEDGSSNNWQYDSPHGLDGLRKC